MASLSSEDGVKRIGAPDLRGRLRRLSPPNGREWLVCLFNSTCGAHPDSRAAMSLRHRARGRDGIGLIRGDLGSPLSRVDRRSCWSTSQQRSVDGSPDAGPRSDLPPSAPAFLKSIRARRRVISISDRGLLDPSCSRDETRELGICFGDLEMLRQPSHVGRLPADTRARRTEQRLSPAARPTSRGRARRSRCGGCRCRRPRRRRARR